MGTPTQQPHSHAKRTHTCRAVFLRHNDMAQPQFDAFQPAPLAHSPVKGIIGPFTRQRLDAYKSSATIMQSVRANTQTLRREVLQETFQNVRCRQRYVTINNYQRYCTAAYIDTDSQD